MISEIGLVVCLEYFGLKSIRMWDRRTEIEQYDQYGKWDM
jgi:hypothetical protein